MKPIESPTAFSKIIDKVFPTRYREPSTSLVSQSLLKTCCKMVQEKELKPVQDWFHSEAFFACYKAIATHFRCLPDLFM